MEQIPVYSDFADTDLAGVCDSYMCYFWGWMLRYLSGWRSYVQGQSWGTQSELDSDAGFLGVWLRKSIWSLWTWALFSLDMGSLGVITKAPRIKILPLRPLFLGMLRASRAAKDLGTVKLLTLPRRGF